MAAAPPEPSSPLVPNGSVELEGRQWRRARTAPSTQTAPDRACSFLSSDVPKVLSVSSAGFREETAVTVEDEQDDDSPKSTSDFVRQATPSRRRTTSCTSLDVCCDDGSFTFRQSELIKPLAPKSRSPEALSLSPIATARLASAGAGSAGSRRHVSHADKILTTHFQPPEHAVREWRYRREARSVQSESLRRLAAWSSLSYSGSDQNIISREGQVDQDDRAARLRRWALVLAIGLCVGVLGFAARRGSEELTNWRLRTGDGAAFMAGLLSVALSVLAVLVTVCAPDVVGSGFEEVKAYLNGIDVPGMLSPHLILPRIVGAVLGISAGLAIGADGPVVCSAACLAGALSQGVIQCGGCKFRSAALRHLRNDTDRRDFVSIGAAAGVAVLFGAPIGGMLFSMEETGREWSTSLSWTTLLCCVTAVGTLGALLGHGAELNDRSIVSFTPAEGTQGNYSSWEIPFFVVVAVLVGCAAALFNWLALRRANLGKRMREATSMWLKGTPPRGWEALPSTVVPFKEARPGMVVHMTPHGMTPDGDVFIGTVVVRKAGHVIMRWNSPDEGGPPPSFYSSIQDASLRHLSEARNESVEPRDWWEGGGRPRTDLSGDTEPTLKGWKQYRSMCDSVEEAARKFGEHPLLTFDKDVEGYYCGRDGRVVQKRSDGLGRVEVRLDFTHTVPAPVGTDPTTRPRSKFWVPWEVTGEPRAVELRRPPPRGPCSPYHPPRVVRSCAFAIPEVVLVAAVMTAAMAAVANVGECIEHPFGVNATMWEAANEFGHHAPRLKTGDCPNPNSWAPPLYSDAASLTAESGTSVLGLLLMANQGVTVFTLTPLILFASVHFVSTVLCAGMFIPQGTFVPLLVFGATVGRISGQLLHDHVADSICPGTYALVGSAAMLSGTMQRPLSMSVILFEATGDPALLVAVMICVLVSSAVAGWFGEPYHEAVMESLDMPFLEPEPPLQMRFFTAGNVMKIPRCFPQRVTLTRLRAMLSSTSHNAYPVVKHLREVVEVVKKGGRRGHSLEVDVLDDYDPVTLQNTATLVKVHGGAAERAGLVRFLNQRLTQVTCFDEDGAQIDTQRRGVVTRGKFRDIITDTRRASRVVLEFEGNSTASPLLGMITRESLYVLLHTASRRYWRTNAAEVGVTLYRSKGRRLVFISAVEMLPTRDAGELQLRFRESSRFGEPTSSSYFFHPPVSLLPSLYNLFRATGVKMTGFDAEDNASVQRGSLVTVDVDGSAEVGVVDSIQGSGGAAAYTVDFPSGAFRSGVPAEKLMKVEDAIVVGARVRIREQVTIPGLRHGSVGIVSRMDDRLWSCVVDFPCSSLDRATWQGHVGLVEGLDDHVRWHGYSRLERGDRPMTYDDYNSCCDNLRVKEFDDAMWGQKKHNRDSVPDKDLWVDLLPYIDLDTYIIPPTFPLTRLFKLYRSVGLRHVVVVDSAHTPIGIISRQELCHRFAHCWLDEQMHWRERRKDPITGEFKTKEQFVEDLADRSDRELEHLWEDADVEVQHVPRTRHPSHRPNLLSEQRLRALHMETEEHLMGGGHNIEAFDDALAESHSFNVFDLRQETVAADRSPRAARKITTYDKESLASSTVPYLSRGSGSTTGAASTFRRSLTQRPPSHVDPNR
eukprot:TRINITY_DN17076_c0_g1_i1.p1 TRINITY_DN17076_c0_g1~~TRINITY_DN17076_c0_g1_i1.p1  ORF type:complete len:1639 (+),score=465.53 TRINITY_DN17076_c0_g1_i1:62-4918(+)